MINITETAGEILSIAKKYNCDAQITIAENNSKDINVREGEIEHLLSSMAFSTGLRLLKNKKSVNVAISGHNFDDMESKIKTAIDSMAYLGEDEA
ncbi:MAG: hypothetical protein GY757_38765, partial [bacterium]|nr:hypothetical protein [bacterium]